MTEKLIISLSDGINTVTVGDDSCDYKLLAHSGFDAADYDVQMSEGGASDGGYISTFRLSSRILEMKWDFGGKNGETARQSLISFFSPRKELTITVTRGTVTRYITGQACDFAIQEKNRFAKSAVNLSILCPDPYFKASDTIQQSNAWIASSLHLSTHLPCALGAENRTDDIEIINRGDTYADMVAVLAANATVTNPFVLNKTNGKKIKIIGTLNRNQSLIISTVRRAKGATVNGTRCIIAPESRFSEFLEMGLNNIECGADVGGSQITANIEYTALFMGV